MWSFQIPVRYKGKSWWDVKTSSVTVDLKVRHYLYIALLRSKKQEVYLQESSNQCSIKSTQTIIFI